MTDNVLAVAMSGLGNYAVGHGKFGSDDMQLVSSLVKRMAAVQGNRC